MYVRPVKGRSPRGLIGGKAILHQSESGVKTRANYPVSGKLILSINRISFVHRNRINRNGTVNSTHHRIVSKSIGRTDVFRRVDVYATSILYWNIEYAKDPPPRFEGPTDHVYAWPTVANLARLITASICIAKPKRARCAVAQGTWQT